MGVRGNFPHGGLDLVNLVPELGAVVPHPVHVQVRFPAAVPSSRSRHFGIALPRVLPGVALLDARCFVWVRGICCPAMCELWLLLGLCNAVHSGLFTQTWKNCILVRT